MKTFFYLIMTSVVSTFAYFGALGSNNRTTTLCCLGIVIGIWVLFFWCWNRRVKKEAQRRYREQIFSNHMRDRHNGRGVK